MRRRCPSVSSVSWHCKRPPFAFIASLIRGYHILSTPHSNMFPAIQDSVCWPVFARGPIPSQLSTRMATTKTLPWPGILVLTRPQKQRATRMAMKILMHKRATARTVMVIQNRKITVTHTATVTQNRNLVRECAIARKDEDRLPSSLWMQPRLFLTRQILQSLETTGLLCLWILISLRPRPWPLQT
jgi:hypothetical protein